MLAEDVFAFACLVARRVDKPLPEVLFRFARYITHVMLAAPSKEDLVSRAPPAMGWDLELITAILGADVDADDLASTIAALHDSVHQKFPVIARDEDVRELADRYIVSRALLTKHVLDARATKLVRDMLSQGNEHRALKHKPSIDRDSGALPLKLSMSERTFMARARRLTPSQLRLLEGALNHEQGTGEDVWAWGAPLALGSTLPVDKLMERKWEVGSERRLKSEGVRSVIR